VRVSVSAPAAATARSVAPAIARSAVSSLLSLMVAGVRVRAGWGAANETEVMVFVAERSAAAARWAVTWCEGAAACWRGLAVRVGGGEAAAAEPATGVAAGVEDFGVGATAGATSFGRTTGRTAFATFTGAGSGLGAAVGLGSGLGDCATASAPGDPIARPTTNAAHRRPRFTILRRYAGLTRRVNARDGADRRLRRQPAAFTEVS
jgi:hypothetical protein